MPLLPPQNTLKQLYGNEDISFHTERWNTLLKTHLEYMNKQNKAVSPRTRLFSAPGRTELAGNHTDHNRGRVLAAAVQLDTIAAVTEAAGSVSHFNITPSSASLPAAAPVVEIYSEGYPPVKVNLSCLDVKEEEKETTDALVRGIAASIVRRGGRIGSFTAHTSSRVLKGSGLSSSAALEILVGSIFNSLFNNKRFSSVELAVMGQEAENTYFGKPCGLMDQCACSAGGAVHINFAREGSPAIEPVFADFNAAGYTLAVVDTGGSHADLTFDYAAIPREMKAVAAMLNGEVLSDISEEKFYRQLREIRVKTGDRALLRAIHFFNENRRVEELVQALKQKDIQSYLNGVNASGRSSRGCLQNVFSPNNSAEQGMALALALSETFLSGEGAVRVHGGGFAGTVQVYVPSEKFEEYRKYMEGFFGDGTVIALSIRQQPAGEIL